MYCLMLAASHWLRWWRGAGTYVITRTLLLRDAQTLRGAGMVLTHVLFRPETNLPAEAGCVQAVPTPHGGVGCTLQDLSIEFENNAGQNSNRGVDLTAASFALVTNVQVVGFHTGLYLSRGPAPGAGPCFFNNIEGARVFACKIAVDVNDDVGYSVNNCNFRDVHASDVGVWSNGTGYRITGYGHRFSRLYAGGLEGHDAVCVEFGSPHRSGVSISGDNLLEALYCENGGAGYGIRASSGTGGRGGNHVIGLHMDGAPLVSTLDDPFGVITLQVGGWSLPPGPPGEAETQGGVPGWRLGQVELYSILGSAAAPGGTTGPPHHMSFWRPEGEQAGHAAGSITSSANGTSVQYNTAADRRLLVPESIEDLVGALDTIARGPAAKVRRNRYHQRRRCRLLKPSVLVLLSCSGFASVLLRTQRTQLKASLRTN